MPISKRQLVQKIVPAGGVDITHARYGESSTFVKHMRAEFLGMWCEVSGEKGGGASLDYLDSSIRSEDVAWQGVESPHNVIVLVTLEGEIFLFPRSARVNAGKVLKLLAPKGRSSQLALHVREVDLSAGEVMEARQRMEDIRGRATNMAEEDRHPPIKVGAIREGLLDEVDPFKPEFDID